MLSAIYSNKRHSEEGFTLIELLIVVIIIGILAAIALPIFIDQQKVAIDASVKSDVRNSVTNITNAQAQKEASAKAAVSNSDTKVALISATTKVATKSVSELSNVPELGSAYSVQGWNAGGKKYQGTAANPGFSFSSITGKFTQDTAAAPTSGSSGNGGNALSTGVADDSDYSGAISDFSFNDYSGAFNGNNSGNLMNATYISLMGGWYSAEENPIVNGPSFLKGGENYSYGNGNTSGNPTDLKIYDKTGALSPMQPASAKFSCSYMSYDIAPNALAPYGLTALNKNTILANFGCTLDGTAGTQAIADSLKGGHITFTDSNGGTNSIPITGAVHFVQ